MATTNSVFITWGMSILGREAVGLEVFDSGIAYFARLKHDGILDDFKVGLAEHGSFDLVSGYVVLEGSEEKLNRVLKSDEYRTLIIKAAHVASNVVVVPCFAGEAIAQRVEQFISARAALGISGAAQ